MSEQLRELVDKLMGTRDADVPGIQAFPMVDSQQLAKELNLRSRAQKSAKADLPDTSNTTPDLAESDIRAAIELKARKATEDYRSQIELYEGRIRRALISTDLRAQIEAAGESNLTDFRVQAIDHINSLHMARKEVIGREREFNEFRTANRLRRPPNLVSGRERLVRWLVLAIFVLIESIMNGMFFAQGSEGGIIGGVRQALVFSVLNIGFATLYATYAFPLLFHVRRLWKFVATIALAAFVLITVVLNLLIAHFRDLFVQFEGHVDVQIIAERFLTAPFLLNDAQSWLLFALGLLLSVVAFIDAAGMDDVYPGYGSVGQRHNDAIDAYTAGKRHCLGELTDIRDKAIGEMTSVIEQMQSAEFDLQLALQYRGRLHENFRAYLAHLYDTYCWLLRHYYEENAEARTSPSPARFGQLPPRPDFLLDRPLDDMFDTARDARRHVARRMEYFIQALNRQFETEVERYHTVDSLTEDRGDDNGNSQSVN